MTIISWHMPLKILQYTGMWPQNPFDPFGKFLHSKFWKYVGKILDYYIIFLSEKINFGISISVRLRQE